MIKICLAAFPRSAAKCLVLLLLVLGGCGSGTGTEPGAGTSEIQRYMQENPGKLATPDDSPADYAAEVAAGAGG